MSLPPARPGGSHDHTTESLKLLERLKRAVQRDHRADQLAPLRRLIELRAPTGRQWQGLAQLALRNAEVTLATRAMKLFVEAERGTLHARFAYAALLDQCGRHAEAHAVIARLPDQGADAASIAYTRGTLALYLGRKDEAREQLERALSLQPQLGPAWLVLAQSSDLKAEPDLAQKIVSASGSMASAPPAMSGPFAYALGQAHAALGDHAAAFAAFDQGNRTLAAQFPYDREADLRGVKAALEGFDAGTVRDISASQRGDSNRAIFLTGLPRSGTTLVEQMLTRHCAVSDGGEVNLLFQLAREAGGQSASALADMTETCASDLWRHLLQERFPAAGRVVDKSINTTRFALMAAALLPDAPIVWMVRDPLDTAWSCFRTCFRGAQPWSHSLEDIAWHFRLEEMLLARTQEILGDRLLVLPYEELVEHPQAWAERLAAHCGLDFEEAMLSPEASARAVTTASVAQVRRPINRDGIGAAKPYAEWLQPFVDARASQAPTLD